MPPKAPKPEKPAAATAASPSQDDQGQAGQDQTAGESQGDQGAGSSSDAAAAPPAAVVTEDNYADVMRSRVPASILAALDVADPDGEAAVLFAEACEVYGINPDPDAREVISEVVYYPGDLLAVPPTPDRVSFVTAGGLKVSQPMTELFEEQLRRWLKAFRMNKATGELEPTDLPDDLTLPREAVTGISTRVDHRYEGGYLRSRALASARSARR